MPKGPSSGAPAQATAQARAAEALAALPDEPAAALAAIEQLLADPALAPARETIIARRDALRAAAEERRRNALRAAAEAVERHIAAGHLVDGRDGLARLPDEAWLAERKRRLGEALIAAERTAEARLAGAIDGAGEAAALDQLAGEVARSGLSEERRQGLAGRIERRRRELAQRSPPKMQRPDAAALWRDLAERTLPLRGALPYSALADAVRSASRQFPDDDRVQLEAFAALPELAQQAETALRLHIGQALPKAECRFGTRTGTFILTRLEKDWIGFRLVDVPAESRADRATAVVPWPQLLAAALSGPDAPRQTAAFLWYWRQPSAHALAALKDDPLAGAVALFERRTRPLDIAGEVERREGGLVSVAYLFAATRNPSYLEAWAGQAELAERGLRWATTQTVSSRAEAELPGLRWKGALRLPVTLEASVQPDAGGEIVLVGLTSGDRSLRVGLNPKRQGFILAPTLDDPAVYEPLAPATPPEYGLVGWTRIRIEVDAGGRFSATLNDRAITSPRELSFPEGARLAPIIQGRAARQGAGLTIESLSVSGRP